MYVEAERPAGSGGFLVRALFGYLQGLDRHAEDFSGFRIGSQPGQQRLSLLLRERP